MTLDYLGSLSVGAAVPSVSAAIAASLPNLQARVTGLLAAQVDLGLHPPTIAASLTTAAAIVASLQAQIALGLEVPSATLQLAAIAAILADLNASVALLVGFNAALGAGGVHAYAYDGQADGLGAALTSELSGGLPGGAPTDHCNALILATSAGATWTAMGSILATS